MTVDEDDPCAAAKALRQVYYGLIAGAASLTISFRSSSGVERSTTFHKADPERLLHVIRGFEAECAAKQGKRPRRYAIRGGGM